MTRIDARTLPDGSVLSAAIAVIGAGPAGIVCALELAAAGHEVLLVESGGERFDPAVQALASTVDEDPSYHSMAVSIRRQLGGTTNLWGGRCVPFDPIDFEPREITGRVEWPTSFAEIEAHMARACDWLECGDPVFDAEQDPALAGRPIVPGFTPGDVLATRLERWSTPTKFGRRYREALDASPNVRVVTDLTCTRIERVPGRAEVAHVEARTLTGKRMVLRAGRYVLACGGLESTRLLLASHRDGDGGIGNHAGHLGRWYMAHVESRIADVHFTTDPAATVAGHERDDAGVYVRRRFTLSPEAQRREGLPNVALWLVNPRLSDAAHRNGFLSLVYLLLRSPIGGRFVADAIRQSHLRVPTSSTVRDHVDNVVREMAGSLRAAGRFAYERFLRRGRKLPGFSMRSDENRYPILYHAEHLPSWHSYVELSDVRDEVGMPRLATHLAFAEADVAAVERVHRLLDASLRSQGLGHVEFLYDDVAAAVRRGVFGGRHQIGTTRMSALPEDGVVDGDLAVHGHDDLFVLASSVFPTSSQANPTLMLVAMALRLAAHLDARAAAPAAGERSGHLARAA